MMRPMRFGDHERAFAVLDPSGDLLTVEKTQADAIRAASGVAPNVQVEGALAGEDGTEAGGYGNYDAFDAPPADQMPAIALRASGLYPIDLDEAMRLSLEEAHGQLVKYFPSRRTRKSGEVVPVAQYETAHSMSRSILGQNYKTAKQTPERPSDVQGLSLLPYNLGGKMSARPLAMRGLGLCVGNSAACRAACLVYSGHNTIDIYNMVVKTSRTEALLLKPLAFARMLVENVRFHMERKRSDYEPFCRLNVFSDIPWELVLPGLFEMFPDDRFYDYTKVPGRETPPPITI